MVDYSGWKYVKDPCGNAYFVRILERTTRDVYQVIAAESIRTFRAIKKENKHHKIRMIEYSGKFDSIDDLLKYLGKRLCMFPNVRLSDESYIGNIDRMKDIYMNDDGE